MKDIQRGENYFLVPDCFTRLEACAYYDIISSLRKVLMLRFHSNKTEFRLPFHNKCGMSADASQMELFLDMR